MGAAEILGVLVLVLGGALARALRGALRRGGGDVLVRVRWRNAQRLDGEKPRKLTAASVVPTPSPGRLPYSPKRRKRRREK